MKKIIMFISLLTSLISSSQVLKISFEYDAAGNQIKRKYCTTCPLRSSNPILKEISELKQEDLQKFHPMDNFSYYPNPVKEELYLKWELVNDNKVSEIEMYSLTGQLLKAFNKLENKDNFVVQFQQYPEGIYTLVLKYTNSDQKSIKIIKQ
jgi:Secretion system C-terminal sorting domain